MSAPAHRRFLRPPELARRYGVEASKILAWIRRGELRALNIALNLTGRPRFIIAEADVLDFEQRRTAKPATKPTRRKKQGEVVVTEFFR